MQDSGESLIQLYKTESGLKLLVSLSESCKGAFPHLSLIQLLIHLDNHIRTHSSLASAAPYVTPAHNRHLQLPQGVLHLALQCLHLLLKFARSVKALSRLC